MKMTLLSLTFILFFSYSLSAQSKWSLGVIGGVELSDVKYDDKFDFVDSNGIPIVNNFGFKIFQIRYGLNVSFDINDRWSIKSGVRINKQGDQTRLNSDLRWGIQHDGQGGFDPTIDPMEPDFFLPTRQSCRFHFVEMPIHVKYILRSSKLAWYIEGGVSPNLFLSKTSRDYDDSGILRKDSDVFVGDSFNKSSASIDLGFGIELSVVDKFKIFVQPMARYYFPPIVERTNDNFRHHFYNFGIEFGVTYGL